MRRPGLALLCALAVAVTVLPARATSDSLYPVQWALQTIGAPAAWAVGGTGAGVIIGIVDTGVDLGHEDFAGRVVASADCVGAKGSAASCRAGGQDDSGHGTHVAGIAVADANNGKGVVGTAYDAKIVAAKVLTNQPGGATGDLDDVGAGIRWAVQHGARVVNLSLGLDDSSNNSAIAALSGTVLQGYIDEAWNAGAIPVVAAGNSGANSPTSYGNVNAIVVTATTRDDRQASYASRTSGRLSDARYAMAAPGGESDGTCPGGPPAGSAIVSTYWDPALAKHDEYACMAGTSMAAPEVAAAAAILLGLGLTRDQTVDRLLSTAKNIGPATTFGSGRLDLAAASAGYGHPVTTTATQSPPATQPPRVRPATTRRPPATQPAVTTTTAAPATTTTTLPPTTQPEPTTTTTTGVHLAAGPSAHHSTRGPNKTAAATVAALGVLAMGGSSVAALRRRRRLA